jgi:hypothetical protein
MWILLVAIVGAPVHIAVNKGLAHWREHGEISAIVTLTLVMLITGVALPLVHGDVLMPGQAATRLAISAAAGLLFGTPIGLIFRIVVRSEAKKGGEAPAPKKSPSCPCSAASRA